MAENVAEKQSVRYARCMELQTTIPIVEWSHSCVYWAMCSSVLQFYSVPITIITHFIATIDSAIVYSRTSVYYKSVQEVKQLTNQLRNVVIEKQKKT